MKKIILASSNTGKIHEIKMFLRNLPFEWQLQSELGIEDADETGLTFVENAILKARHACEISGLPALADDSGLVIDALHGAPGIYSARYAGKNASNSDRIQKVLGELKHTPPHERSARFYCVLALMQHPKDPSPIICEGVWEGEILEEARGHQGFGYDPIFYVASHGCSAAELDPLEKNRISHRGQALTQFAQQLVNK